MRIRLRRHRRLRRLWRLHKDLPRRKPYAPPPEITKCPSSFSKTVARDAPSAPRSARYRPASRYCWRANETGPSDRDRELSHLAWDGGPLHLGPLSRAVAERVVHASADLEYAESLILDEAALETGISNAATRRARRYRRGDGGGRDHRPLDALPGLRP